MTALVCGAQLGPYELLVPLGKGGMATVWVARLRGQSNGFFALKAMLPELARDPDFRAMFLEEGQLVRSIEHENVVKVHEVGEEHGILYMAMDWVEGDSLRALILEAQKRRPIPPEIAVKLIADAAAGLHAAHELRGWDGELRNLVHCDVSPHNILVGVDGRAKIADFGVANATHHASFGIEDRIMGKFAYMSPEQASGRRLDRRSDVFSLGIVLFELTTGERLFRGAGPAHTLNLVLSGQIPDPRQLLPGYPDRLAEISLRALARDPRERFQSADALRSALDQYLVEARIVVSTGSVRKLVERVLGRRIEALRRDVERACFTPEVREEDTGTPRPATHTKAPAPQRSLVLPFLSALGGIAAATSSILWVLQQRPGTKDLNFKSAASESAPAPGSPSRTAEPSPAGIDVQSIPLGATPSPPPSAAKPSPGPLTTKVQRAPVPKGGVVPKSIASSAPTTAPSPAESAIPVVLEETPVAPTPPPTAVVPSEPAPFEPAPFNRGAAIASLNAAVQRSASCTRPNGPSGSGRASVTFFPDGRVAKVVVSAPFEGTETGLCVANAFRTARVPAFTGSAVTLPASFRVK